MRSCERSNLKGLFVKMERSMMKSDMSE